MSGAGGPDPSDRLRRALSGLARGRAALLAALVACLAFANAVGNGFAYDDVHIVVEDDALGDLSRLPERLAAPYWPEDAAGELGLWRPLTTAAFSVQAAAWGRSPALFHLVNVLLHGLATGLVVLVAAELLPVAAALGAGLFFAVHPVHVEAVANVVGLGELLAAAFYLGACLLFLRGTRTARPADGPAWPRLPAGGAAGVALLYAGAFLAKESAVTLPAALVVLDAARRPVPLRRLGSYLRVRGPLLLLLAAVAGGVLAARLAVLGSVASPDPPLGAHLLEEIPRIWTLGVIWFHTARLLLLPFGLSVEYGPDVIPVLTVWTFPGLVGAAAVLAALGGGWWAWRRGGGEGAEPGGTGVGLRVVGLASAWLLVTLSPVANALFLTGVLLAERTLYVPSVGVALALGWAGWRLTHRAPRAGLALALAVLLAFGVRSWTRTPTWASTATVFTTLVADHPESGRAQWTLGDQLASEGRLAEANRAYRAAVGRLDSSYRLLMEVGWDAASRGDLRLGRFLLGRAWEDQPERASAPRRLTVLAAREGRHDDVVAWGRRTVELAPGDAASWHLVAGSLEALGRFREAAAARERVIASGEGGRWQQWLSLARLRLTLGDTVAARAARDSALARADDAGAAEAVREGFQPLSRPEERP